MARATGGTMNRKVNSITANRYVRTFCTMGTDAETSAASITAPIAPSA